jgi:hypothetical protein
MSYKYLSDIYFERKFEIITDYAAWKWFVSMENLTERLAR